MGKKARDMLFILFVYVKLEYMAELIPQIEELEKRFHYLSDRL